MFTEMSNSRSSGYPLVNVTEYRVDGVMSLNCLVDSWVWRPLTLNFLIIFLVYIIFIPPLDHYPSLEVDHPLDLHLHLKPDPRLELVEMLGWKIMVDLVVTPGFRRQTECEPCTCQDQQFTYTSVT
jgi:hypothetical protein